MIYLFIIAALYFGIFLFTEEGRDILGLLAVGICLYAIGLLVLGVTTAIIIKLFTP